MKTRIQLAILFIILLISAILLFLSNRDSTLKNRVKKFSVENTEQVDKIIIARGESRLQLKKENNRWKINGIYHGNPAAINFLLQSLSRLEIKSPVSNVNREKVVNMLNSGSKNIEIYSRKKLIKSISVYHDTSGVAGTYMMLKKSRTPFIMKIKGCQDINIDRIFSLDTEIWCDKTIFNYMPDEIKNLVIEYPGKPEKSFQIINTGEGIYYIKHPDKEQVINDYNKEKVAEYLYSFMNIKFNFLQEPDTYILENNNPFVIISLTGINDITLILEGYRKYLSKEIITGSEYDIDCFYALSNYESEPIELKYIDFDPILKDIDYFIKK